MYHELNKNSISDNSCSIHGHSC